MYDSFVLTAVKDFIYEYTIVDLFILLVDIFINFFHFLSFFPMANNSSLNRCMCTSFSYECKFCPGSVPKIIIA